MLATDARERAWWGQALERHYGIRAVLTRLPGEYDLNLGVTVDGALTHVLKVMRPDCDRAFVDMQCQALETLQREAADVPVPRVVHSTSGEAWVEAAGEQGDRRIVWLVSALPGRAFAEVRPQPLTLVREIGATLARVATALRGFSHPLLSRPTKWDLQEGAWIGGHLDCIDDSQRRARVREILQRFESDLRPRIAGLPRAAIHNDLNDFNVLVSGSESARPRVSGLIDFGDMILGADVCDIAIGAAYAILGQDRPIDALCAFVAGYHSVRELNEEEVALLYPLVLMRLAVSVTNAAIMKRERPDDPYVTVTEAPAWRFLDDSVRLPEDWVHCSLRRTVGRSGLPGGTRILQWLERIRNTVKPVIAADFANCPIVDLSIDGAMSPEDPHRFDAGYLYAPIAAELGPQGIGIGRYGEPRLIYSAPAFIRPARTGSQRRTVHGGVDLFAPAGTRVHAPIDAVVADVTIRPDALDYGGVVLLQHRTDDGDVFFTLYGHLAHEVATRLKAGDRLAAGTPFAQLGTPSENGGWPPHLHFQLALSDLGRGADLPGVFDADELDAWTSLFPNPSALLDMDADRVDGRPPADEALAAHRAARFSRNLKTSYRTALSAARGWRHFLFDASGREYLDCYNNVPHVGHCHPAVVAAVSRQLRSLNTNTRYLHALQAEYADALLQHLPDPFSVCFLVNSGSEANELALRLARARTGAIDTVVLAQGYHGNTNTAIDISHYKFAGPGGRGKMPWVHVAELPDVYRHPGRLFAESFTAQIDAIRSSGASIAAFICETFPSVAGQIVLPSGYLQHAYAAIRAAGGVCIADEVQTGFGRLGGHFWGFEAHGVVPDIVVLGKPIGNGYPIGAVVTTRAIADAFNNGMEFFSTFGGSTVSCAAGLAVLRVVEDEGIQHRSHQVGGMLMRELQALAKSYPLIGDVRGSGLFLGIELSQDRKTREPATAQARHLVNRLKDLRVLAGTEGAFDNVIKIRPPLSFDAAGVDRLVACLDRVLGEDPCRV